MTHCEICMPTVLHYHIRFAGNKNIKHIPKIKSYLEKNDLLINGKDEVLVVKEQAVAGLYDYFKDNMDEKEISFHLDGKDWQPIADALHLLDSQWIDRVIFNEAVNFHIQPIVNAERNVYGYEMLARFIDEEGERISPLDVFEAAKKRNRTYALDRVCRISAVSSAIHVAEKVFINFIPTSIYSPEHCLRSTVKLADDLGIDPSRLVFEVVETEKVDDLDHLKNILMYYKDKGFHYALDDVGDGYSTRGVLEQLAPDYMKLDIKYVQGVSSDTEKQAIALSFLDSAYSVDAIPLAEGIEEEEDFIWLKNKGYQLFQGYYFGKPTPITKIN